jgi:hypothetical protein
VVWAGAEAQGRGGEIHPWRRISPATLTWDKEAMDCFRSQGKAHIIFFGINSAEDYRTAKNWALTG